MCAALALLVSPLLGPMSWQPVATAVRAHGHRATVVAHEGPAPSATAAVIEAFLAGLAEDEEWVLVPHSNAGLFAPAVARARQVSGVVYVDSRLPETGRRPMKSGGSLAFLVDLADAADVLPPWHKWWEDDIGELFSSPSVQRECEAQMRQLPLSYFSDHLDGSGWDALPSAYLAFGEGYAAERDRAAGMGWPVATIEESQHLHQLVDPVGVAVELERLISAMGLAG